jgi:protein-S-isoprenylcysteine O-methyltransferase Ste14
VLLAAALLPLISGVVAGFDLRLHWGPAFPVTVQWVAAAVVAIGFVIVVWAMWANAYFSAIVRIQEDRGHSVATGGPYRIVRHPGYVGAILFTVAMPVMLGSVLALIPALLAGLVYILRTRREDDTLQAELPGYKEFTQQTRYRLIPGVW